VVVKALTALWFASAIGAASSAAGQTESYPRTLTATDHFFESGWVVVGNNEDTVVAIHPNSIVREFHMMEVAVVIANRVPQDSENGLGEFDYAVANIRANCGTGVIGSRMYAVFALDRQIRGSHESINPTLPEPGTPLSGIIVRGCQPEMMNRLQRHSSVEDVVRDARGEWARDLEVNLVK
jgi:hypothetical protein